MQRFEEIHLPPDPVFPDELAELGFFVTEDDKIRVIESPGQAPRYKIDRNDRVNKVHIEALHSAIHRIIADRLTRMSMNPYPIPADGVAKSTAPVFVSDNISTASRIVVFIGELVEDLGLFSYREACDEGISFGSVLDLTKAVLGENPENSANALILANPGQRVWHNASGSPLTVESFRNRAQHSAVVRERPMSLRNAVESNTSLPEHTKYVFERILLPSLPLGVKVDIIGLSEGGYAALMYLKKNWMSWWPHISSIGLVNPEQVADVDFDFTELKNPKSFVSFVRERGRAWVLSSQPLGAREVGLGMHGCNCYSSGEDKRIACMVSRALAHIMAWANLMHSIPSLAEDIVVVEGEPNPSSKVISAMLGMDIDEDETTNGDEDEMPDNAILEGLEGFVNGLALKSNLVSFGALAADDTTEAGENKLVYDNDDIIDETPDGENSDDSDVTVVHDPQPSFNNIVTRQQPQYGEPEESPRHSRGH